MLNGAQKRVGGLPRRLVAAAALVPVLARATPAAARTAPVRGPGPRPGPRGDKAGKARLRPVTTTEAQWRGVADAIGRQGSMLRGMTYHVGFPRTDLRVVSYGIAVKPTLALVSSASFVRYSDGTTLMMGDLVCTEGELQHLLEGLQRHGIDQTAVHKHLLAQTPDLWWTHVHAHGRDAEEIARGLRAAIDRTNTPPPASSGPPPRKNTPLEGIDTDGIDDALGTKGTNSNGVWRCVFVRRETITDGGMVLPTGLSATSAFNFQPLGDGRAALNGDFVMIADEVQDVLKALCRGKIHIVELHNHGLTDEPRLFFTHLWAVGDAVSIAKALRRAVDVTNVKPPPTEGLAGE
ncbi:peptidase M23 [Streptomyces griseocarneus]|nr:peptidase M23 [Streptomyces griseocarneus]